jgi:hypothetical protein
LLGKEKELRKLKLLAALLAMMAAIASVTVAPAMANHWDFYGDPEGECGWNWIVEYPYLTYDCHSDEGESRLTPEERKKLECVQLTPVVMRNEECEVQE